MAIYFKSVKRGKKYKVVAMDKAKGTITFQGQFGTFTEEYSKERFQKLGYELVNEPDEPAKEEEKVD